MRPVAAQTSSNYQAYESSGAVKRSDSADAPSSPNPEPSSNFSPFVKFQVFSMPHIIEAQRQQACEWVGDHIARIVDHIATICICCTIASFVVVVGSFWIGMIALFTGSKAATWFLYSGIGMLSAISFMSAKILLAPDAKTNAPMDRTIAKRMQTKDSLTINRSSSPSSYKEGQPIGLANSGNTCFINASLQLVLNEPHLKDALIKTYKNLLNQYEAFEDFSLILSREDLDATPLTMDKTLDLINFLASPSVPSPIYQAIMERLKVEQNVDSPKAHLLHYIQSIDRASKEGQKAPDRPSNRQLEEFQKLFSSGIYWEKENIENIFELRSLCSDLEQKMINCTVLDNTLSESISVWTNEKKHIDVFLKVISWVYDVDSRCTLEIDDSELALLLNFLINTDMGREWIKKSVKLGGKEGLPPIMPELNSILESCKKNIYKGREGFGSDLMSFLKQAYAASTLEDSNYASNARDELDRINKLVDQRNIRNKDKVQSLTSQIQAHKKNLRELKDKQPIKDIAKYLTHASFCDLYLQILTPISLNIPDLTWISDLIELVKNKKASFKEDSISSFLDPRLAVELMSSMEVISEQKQSIFDLLKTFKLIEAGIKDKKMSIRIPADSLRDLTQLKGSRQEDSQEDSQEFLLRLLTHVDIRIHPDAFFQLKTVKSWEVCDLNQLSPESKAKCEKILKQYTEELAERKRNEPLNFRSYFSYLPENYQQNCITNEGLLTVALPENPATIEELLNNHFTHLAPHEICCFFDSKDTPKYYKIKEQIATFAGKAPKQLLVHLKRFEVKEIESKQPDGSSTRTYHNVKNSKVYNIPEFFKIADQDYEVTSFVVHEGHSFNSGHYYSYVKKAGVWWICDDQSIQPLDKLTDPSDPQHQEQIELLKKGLLTGYYYAYRACNPADVKSLIPPTALNLADKQSKPNRSNLGEDEVKTADRI